MDTLRLNPLTLTAAVVIGVAAIGAAITALPGDAPAPAAPVAAEPAADDGFGRLFREGVEFLKQGRTHEAIIVFEAANQLKPHMPEVPVNLGFAYLARDKHDVARRHFEHALELKPDQANAYYGLASALDGLGDLEGALGSLRTFVHLEKGDTPFRAKAMAGIWELEEKLKAKRAAEAPKAEAPK